MASPTPRLAGSAFLFALLGPLGGQTLEDAEVRLPYRELRELIDRAAPAPESAPHTPEPALLAARLKISLDQGRPVVEASLRVASFDHRIALVPLVSGGVTLDRQQPDDARILLEEGALCLAVDQPGSQSLVLRLLADPGKDGFTLKLPPCAAAVIEAGALPADHAILIRDAIGTEILPLGSSRPLPAGRCEWTVRVLDPAESTEALRPPVPSTWSWQHEALVVPREGEIEYQLVSRASAGDGSGVEATLPLPDGARDVTVAGDDLASHRCIRGQDRRNLLSLQWKTRGQLDRRITLSYRMPLRPLDRIWRLEAPGASDSTRTRFIIATEPLLAYSAKGLSAALAPDGLPAPLAAALDGTPCQHLEATNAADLGVQPVPVAATAEGVVAKAEWLTRIERDGALLTTGSLTIEHKTRTSLELDTPAGMKLLSCEAGGRAIAPVDLGDGRLRIVLQPQDGRSTLHVAFTGSGDPLDPVSGTLHLTLPKTPFFIHELRWAIGLPPGHEAETHGNLARTASTAPDDPAIRLTKNLCRDERPEIRVFYQRPDAGR